MDERTLLSEYAAGVPPDRSVKDLTSGKSTDTGSIEKYARALCKLHNPRLVY